MISIQAMKSMIKSIPIQKHDKINTYMQRHDTGLKSYETVKQMVFFKFCLMLQQVTLNVHGHTLLAYRGYCLL